MVDKKGAGSDVNATGDAAARKSAPKKGARAGGETTPQRTGRAGKAAAPTAETGAMQAPDTAGSGTKAGSKGARAGSTRRAGASGKAGGKKSATDLRSDLRDFASGRPDGWGHEDWLKFLDDLQARGHNINDRDEIGSMLERERLALALERIPGLGPQRVRNIADRYGYLWRLRETDADQLAREANVPRSVAEKVVNTLGR